MRKKILSLLSLFLIMILFCSCNSESITTAQKKNYGSGKEITFDLDTDLRDMGLGYSWGFETLEGDDYGKLYLDRVDGRTPDSDEVETTVTRTYCFIATKEGEQSITFTFREPWDGGRSKYDVVYDVVIDSDLNITCTDKRKGIIENDIELDFFPDPKFN